MNQLFATRRGPRNAATRTAVPDLHLQGWSLTIARIVWFGIAVCDLAVFLVSIPAYYVQLSMPCTDPQQGCLFGQLMPSSTQALHSLGLALGDYAAFTLTLDLIVSLVLLAVGVLIFRHKSVDVGFQYFLFGLAGNDIETLNLLAQRVIPAIVA